MIQSDSAEILIYDRSVYSESEGVLACDVLLQCHSGCYYYHAFDCASLEPV